MASTEVQICNRALVRIGQTKAISSLEDSSAEGRASKLVNADARDELLEMFEWPFAKKQATLAELADETRSPWTYAYALPADCLKPRSIWTGSRRPRADQRIPFEIQIKEDLSGQMLMCDEADAELIYTAKVTAVPVFPRLFAEALAWKVAIELSMALPIKREFRMDAERSFEIAFSRAASRALDDVQEDVEPDSLFISSRS